jgi:hypothetical protein
VRDELDGRVARLVDDDEVRQIGEHDLLVEHRRGLRGRRVVGLDDRAAEDPVRDGLVRSPENEDDTAVPRRLIARLYSGFRTNEPFERQRTGSAR